MKKITLIQSLALVSLSRNSPAKQQSTLSSLAVVRTAPAVTRTILLVTKGIP